MKKFTKFLSLVIIIFIMHSLSFAQEIPELKVKVHGTLQSMVSYAEPDSSANQFGVGLKRVRLKVSMSYGENLKGFVQYSTIKNKLYSAHLTYFFSPKAKIRIGRFKGAGVMAGGLNKHMELDIVERAVAGQKWGALTVGNDFHDYGIAFFGKAAGFEYNLTLHNGDGEENVTASHKTAAANHKTDMAISAMASYKPAAIKGLRVGGYYGVGNEIYNEYISHSCFVYYEPKPVRVKVEYVSVEKGDVTSFGYYIFGAYKVLKNLELVSRYDVWDKDDAVSSNEEKDITIGAVYSLYPRKWNSAKITAAYVVQQEKPSVANNIFYLMFQFIF